MPTKLTVTTEFGTFKRSTVRTYTHLVIVKGYRAEKLERYRLESIAYDRKLAKAYRQGLDSTGRRATASTQEQLNTWADEYDQKANALEARGPITQDANTWGMDEQNLTSTPTWGALGWCGRLDLARKLATGKQASLYRDVVIIDVATGQVVR